MAVDPPGSNPFQRVHGGDPRPRPTGRYCACAIISACSGPLRHAHDFLGMPLIVCFNAGAGRSQFGIMTESKKLTAPMHSFGNTNRDQAGKVFLSSAHVAVSMPRLTQSLSSSFVDRCR